MGASPVRYGEAADDGSDGVRQRHTADARLLPSGVHGAWHDGLVSWPPQIGELLPRAEDAYGVREKLTRYALNADHDDGGAKAAGFAAVLGITAADLEYLATALLAGVQEHATAEVRDRGEHGMHCRVIIPVAGIGERADRVANVRTVWEIRWEGDAPRLVTAYITTKLV